MKKLLRITVLLLTVLLGYQHAQAQTTVFVVRHAEKEGADPANRNPGLSGAGRQRATDLQQILEKENIAAVFSTRYERTLQTAQPTAAKRNLQVISYDPSNLAALAARIQKDFNGKKVLIVGHSNTVLETVEALGGKRPVPQLSESDYGYLFQVTLQANETAATTFTTYGDTSR